MNLVIRIIRVILETSWSKLLLHQSQCRYSRSSTVDIGANTKIDHCRIIVEEGATLCIGSEVCLRNAEIYLAKGSRLEIGPHSIIIGSKSTPCSIIVVEGSAVKLGHHTKLSLKRIWCRFGGQLSIGNYTNINHDSEVRCDERIDIGSYCQISQYVNIWDTNTHNILPTEERRHLTEAYFPYFGFESTRPKTKAVVIGDDCWIGERASILKGTKLGRQAIVGYNTAVISREIPDCTTVVQDVNIKTF